LNKEWPDITEAVLLDYLDDALDAEARGRVEACLQRDPEARRALEKLRGEEEALFALGRDLRAAAPQIDLASLVLEGITEADTVPGSLEDELARLGASLRALTPPVDLAASITAMVSEAEGATVLAPLERELVAVGDELRTGTPVVNLVPPVLVAVERTAAENVVPFRSRERYEGTRRRRSPLSWWLIAAAAAGLVLGVGLFLAEVMQPERLVQVNIARHEAQASAQTARETALDPPPPVREGEPLSLLRVRPGELDTMSALVRPTSIEGVDPAGQTGDVVRAEFTVEDIVNAKRKALEGQADALAMLARWGALDPDEVRRLLAQGMLTPQQLAGMSRFLPDGEARDLLRDAIKQTPDDPTLRLALAKSLMADPAGYEEALQQLASLREMAPDNALVHYMDARLRFSMGDYPGALSELEYASNLNAGSAYGVENAQNHSAALQAAGLPADLADTVAAFYAGTDEYGAVAQLRSELLGYGEYFESLGDYDTAMGVYKGVGMLGQQVAEGAAYTNEYLAGLDTQAAAIEAMNALADMVDVPGGLQTVQETYRVFVDSLNIFMEYTNLLDGVVQMEDVSLLLNTVGSILQTGDIQYLQNLIL